MWGFYYRRLFEVEVWSCHLLPKVCIHVCLVVFFLLKKNNLFLLIILKIWMSAQMEPTCAVHMLTARTQWVLIVACVKKVILGMASLVQVSFLKNETSTMLAYSPGI